MFVSTNFQTHYFPFLSFRCCNRWGWTWQTSQSTPWGLTFKRRALSTRGRSSQSFLPFVPVHILRFHHKWPMFPCSSAPDRFVEFEWIFICNEFLTDESRHRCLHGPSRLGTREALSWGNCSTAELTLNSMDYGWFTALFLVYGLICHLPSPSSHVCCFLKRMFVIRSSESSTTDVKTFSAWVHASEVD